MSQLHRIDPKTTEAKVDVIFVHGLGGDAFTTWQHGKSRADSWPYWLAEEVPEAALWTLAYEASPFGWLGRSLPLVQRAQNLLGVLLGHGIGQRPLVLICHSLGGLVVKQLLRKTQDESIPAWRAIGEQTKAVVFLGTPHRGADLASTLFRLGKYLGASPSLKDLQTHNGLLSDLNAWYGANAPGLDVATHCFYETLPTKGVMIVEEDSGNIGVPGTPTYPQVADHSSICKPDRRGHPLCGYVAGVVREWVRTPNDPKSTIADPLALPADLVDFQDRGVKQRALLAALEGGENAAITAIGGMGGIGKTALAVHLANRLKERFPDGVRYIDLQGVAEKPLAPPDAMGRIVRSFDPTAQVPESPEQAQALYRHVLESKRVLLLLDNARGNAQVHALLRHRAPTTAILVTSRNREIGFDGLRRFDLDQMTPAEARVFLRTMLPPARATDDQLDRIAERAGHLPLALRVAGRFLEGHPGWTVAEYVEAVDAAEVELRLEGEPDKDVLAVLGLSATQLERDDPDLARRWRQLQVFPADLDRAAAAAVWALEAAGARGALDALIARSMLLLDQTTRRHRLHDLMRQVAARATTEEDDLPAARARHAVHYCQVLGDANALYLTGGASILEGLALYDMEQGNIVAGQAWAAAHMSSSEAGIRLTAAYPSAGVQVVELRLHPHERIEWLKPQLAAFRCFGDRSGEGAALGNLGIAYKDSGEMCRSIEHHRQALVISREIGDRRAEAQDLGNLGKLGIHDSQVLAGPGGLVEVDWV